MNKYMNEYWIQLVDKLLEEGYCIDEAEKIADENCKYKGGYNLNA